MHYVRLLNMRDIEFYEVFKKYCGDSLGYILLVDTRRPSKFTDNPAISKIELEEDFNPADNFIKAYVFSQKEQEKDFIDATHLFIIGLIETKPNSSFYINRVVTDKELTFDFPFDMMPILEYIKPYVEKDVKVDFSSITNKKFNYLSQD